MRLGLEYTSGLPADRIRDVIHVEAERMGYSVEILESSQESTRLRTRFASFQSCLRAALLRLPTDVYWEVRSRGKEACLYCDSKITGAYLWMLTGSCVLFVACYSRGAKALFVDWERTSTLEVAVDGLLLAVSLVLIFVNYAMLLGGGMARLSRVFGRIRLEAIEAGSTLCEAGAGISPRQLCRITSYLAFCVLVLFKPVCGNLPGPGTLGRVPLSILVFLGLLISLVLVLVSALPLIARSPGFGLRLTPGLPGVLTSASVLLLLCAQIPWVAAEGHFAPDVVEAFTSARAYFNNAPNVAQPTKADGTPITRDEFSSVFGKSRVWGWTCWFGTVFLIVLAACIFLLAIEGVLQSYPYLYQMAKRPDCEWTQRATEGRTFMTKMRVTFGLTWFVLGLCLALAVARTVLTTSYCFVSAGSQGESAGLNAIEASVLFTSLALNVPSDSPLLSSVIWASWAIYLSVCWILLLSSATSLLIQRLRFAARVRAHAGSVSQCIVGLSDRIALMWRRRSSLPCPGLVLSHSAFPAATAQRIGFLTGRTAIELSTGCLGILQADELDAVLAHELAHCLARHCLVDDIARFLGRCTFVGDGFARMLQDSFGYEVQADRLAVDGFGIRPEALKRCLWKYRSVVAVKQIEWLSGLPMSSAGSPDNTDPAMVFDYRSLSRPRRLWLGLGIFLAQYLGKSYSGYWHPSVEHRISILDQIGQAPSP